MGLFFQEFCWKIILFLEWQKCISHQMKMHDWKWQYLEDMWLIPKKWKMSRHLILPIWFHNIFLCSGHVWVMFKTIPTKLLDVIFFGNPSYAITGITQTFYRPLACPMIALKTKPLKTKPLKTMKVTIRVNHHYFFTVFLSLSLSLSLSRSCSCDHHGPRDHGCKQHVVASKDRWRQLKWLPWLLLLLF